MAFQYPRLVRIGERLSQPAQLQARGPVFIETQDGFENSINKNKSWAWKQIKLRPQSSGNCSFRGMQSGLEGEPADRSYICIFPVLESRRREAKLHEPVDGAPPKAIQPVQTLAWQSAHDLGKLSCAVIPFRDKGAHVSTAAGCSSHEYPRSSSSSASSFAPDRTIDPPMSTCTRSGSTY